jgi:hypothetical protein
MRRHFPPADLAFRHGSAGGTGCSMAPSVSLSPDRGAVGEGYNLSSVQVADCPIKSLTFLRIVSVRLLGDGAQNLVAHKLKGWEAGVRRPAFAVGLVEHLVRGTQHVEGPLERAGVQPSAFELDAVAHLFIATHLQ